MNDDTAHYRPDSLRQSEAQTYNAFSRMSLCLCVTYSYDWEFFLSLARKKISTKGALRDKKAYNTQDATNDEFANTNTRTRIRMSQWSTVTIMRFARGAV